MGSLLFIFLDEGVDEGGSTLHLAAHPPQSPGSVGAVVRVISSGSSRPGHLVPVISSGLGGQPSRCKRERGAGHTLVL